jgi:hypothetical protein
MAAVGTTRVSRAPDPCPGSDYSVQSPKRRTKLDIRRARFTDRPDVPAAALLGVLAGGRVAYYAADFWRRRARVEFARRPPAFSLSARARAGPLR